MAVVVWSDTAKQQLRSIHSFHYVNTSPLAAAKLLITLVDAADILESSPTVASIDPEFADLGEIRALVVRQTGKKPQYKLMYLVEGDTCYILSVWNTRRSPSDQRHAVQSGLSN